MSDDKKMLALPPGFKESWSISIYAGNSPVKLKPQKHTRIPTITRHDVTDITALFVADPFMIYAESKWYLFMEIMNADTGCGEMGLVTSANGIDWEYQQVILKEAFHLSYPFVFEHEGTFYMIPETLDANAVRLYKATAFPYSWEYITDLVTGQYADPTLVLYKKRWWLFTSAFPYKSNTLNLFYADDLRAPFKEHPQSPVISEDKRRARPSGRIIKHEARLIRFCQDCFPAYGSCVRAFEITALTTNKYAERELPESPVLNPAVKKRQWNSRGMHHIDAHKITDGNWLACVDGCYGETKPFLKKRAVWIFDNKFKVPAFLSVASFREHSDMPVTLVYIGHPDEEMMNIFNNLGGKIDFIIEPFDHGVNGNQSINHKKNRFMRMEIMGKWADEQVILFDCDTVFSKKIRKLIPFIDKNFKEVNTDLSLVWGVTESDDLFYIAERKDNGKLANRTEAELKISLKDIYGRNWNKRLSGMKYNNGVLVMYNCSKLARQWKSHYQRGLNHPTVNPEDDQLPLSIAMYDLKTQVMNMPGMFNSRGKLSGEYAVYHAFDSRWKRELEKITSGSGNLEDYGIIASKHINKIPAHWLKENRTGSLSGHVESTLNSLGNRENAFIKNPIAKAQLNRHPGNFNNESEISNK